MTARPPSSPQPPRPPRQPASPDWAAIRDRAKAFPPPAFDFVRDGLAYAVEKLSAGKQAEAVPENEAVIAAPGSVTTRHISGQQLCLGLRDMARERYGMLALTVLHRWGVRATDDFGVMVYALIDRGEMRSSHEDRFEDFSNQFDFNEAFNVRV